MTITVQKNKTNDTNCTIQGVSWLQLESIEAAFSDIEGVRFAYLDGVLEIMTLSSEHEDFKSTLGLLLEAYMRHSGIRFYGSSEYMGISKSNEKDKGSSEYMGISKSNEKDKQVI